MKTRRTNYLIIALILLALAIGVTGVLVSVNAEKATVTQHWELLTGDSAWLVTPPECNLQITEFGGSYYLTCVESKGE